jgi:hypothetical protein
MREKLKDMSDAGGRIGEQSNHKWTSRTRSTPNDLRSNHDIIMNSTSRSDTNLAMMRSEVISRVCSRAMAKLHVNAR